MTSRSISKEDCPFDNHKVDEAEFAGTEDFAAIYNSAPVLPGHTLIIPRRHVENLLDLEDTECCRMVEFARQVTKVLLSVFEADSFDWTIQNGEAAGQTVPHVHLHIIPRYTGDLAAPGDWYPELEQMRADEAAGSEGGPLDSSERPQISASERTRLVALLREAAKDEGQ